MNHPIKNEKLLQFIWFHCLFQFKNLFTEQGERLLIFHPGQWNHHQGPDFTQAKIKLDTTLWHGHVEVHLFASDWWKHHHQADPHYKNVILHVVAINDLPPDELPPIPTLCLEGRIPFAVIQRYDKLFEQKTFIPCQAVISNIPALVLLK